MTATAPTIHGAFIPRPADGGSGMGGTAAGRAGALGASGRLVTGGAASRPSGAPHFLQNLAWGWFAVWHLRQVVASAVAGAAGAAAAMGLPHFLQNLALSAFPVPH